MNATKSIWGEPLVSDRKGAKGSFDCFEAEDDSIERELRTFLDAEIRSWKPDIIVVYERKGTAILRALIECGDTPLDWSWAKVISSTSLDQLPDDALRNRRILIFDDMVRTGGHIRKALEALKARGVFDEQSRNVRLVAFAVHQQFTRSSIGGRWLDSWFYRDLTTTAYAKIRDRIICLLQKSGSLMLDTEHIEVRIRMREGFNRLLTALRRRSDPVEFRSAGGRTNITVFYPDDASHKLPADRFPENSGFTHIVKKCRIVERDTPDEFAIIPICLPAIPTQDGSWVAWDNDARMLGDGITNRIAELATFYGVALVASLYPLEWILKDLYASEMEDFVITLPSDSDASLSRSGYTLNHLKVMYPSLRTDLLTRQIAEVEKRAHTEGRELRRLKHQPRPALSFPNEELYANAMSLLQAIRHTLDARKAEASQTSSEVAVQRCTKGLRASQIFRLGTEKFGWEPPRISTLFDILIDDAKLVTRVERTLDEETNRERWTRTFEPDGEVVSDLVRRYTAQWGLPRGF